MTTLKGWLRPILSKRQMKRFRLGRTYAIFQAFTVVVLVTICSLVSVPPSTARAKPNSSSNRVIGAHGARFNGARAYIREAMRRERLPSVAVAVAKNGKIIWQQAFGWANVETRQRATPGTMYSLASTTKPFTATAVMQLVEQGKIRLDAPANEYLGMAKLKGYAGNAGGATIRRILSHTSGLPPFWQFLYADEDQAPPSMETTIRRYGILVTPPGAIYQYSNLGYGILGYIISRVSRMSYAEYMRTHVFLPLRLRHTAVGIPPGLARYAAVRYDRVKLGPLPSYTVTHVGASAIYSSAHDLVRFGMFQLGDHLAGQQPILTNATINQMHKPVVPIGFHGAEYALGWFVQPDDHGYVDIFHPGEMPGTTACLSLYPAANLTVAVLTNRNIGSLAIQPISQHIVAAVLAKYAVSLLANPHQYAPPPDLRYKLVRQLAGRWAGHIRTWQARIPLEMDFRPDGDIHIKLGDELKTLLDDARWDGHELVAFFPGEVPTPDADRRRTFLRLDLWLRDGNLSGEINAVAVHHREYYSLPSWVKLARVAGRN